MLKGTFSYNWLEDDDPWNYATGSKYVSLSYDYNIITNGEIAPFYLLPGSPQSVNSLFGIIHQITPDLFFTIKFFINLFLIIGVIAFFLFAYTFSDKNHLFALIATFILVITPCFVGHFIFNYTISVVLFLVFLFTLSLALKEFKLLILSSIMCAGVIMAHPVASFQTAILLFFLIILFLIIEIKNKKFTFKKKYFINYKESLVLRIILIGIIGFLLSLFFYVQMFQNSFHFSDLSKRAVGKTGAIALNYTIGSYDIKDEKLRDFFIAYKFSQMDQEKGVGIFLFSLCLFGIFLFYFIKDKLHSKNLIYLVMFLWYFIFLWLLTGGIFHFSLLNYRWWSIFAIFIALHAAATIIIIIKLFKKNVLILTPILIILFIGLIYTSAIPRYTVQTSQWPPGVGFNSYEQVQGNSNLMKLGYNNKIFNLCDNSHLIAFNQINYAWENDIREYFLYLSNSSNDKNRYILINKSDQLINKYGFEYIIVDSGCVSLIGPNETNNLLQYYIQNPNYQFRQDYSNNAFFLFKYKS